MKFSFVLIFSVTKKEGIEKGSPLFDISRRKDSHVVNLFMERYTKALKYISSLVLRYEDYENLYAGNIDELFAERLNP